MTRPAPWFATCRRNGASVTPDMGAKSTGFAAVSGPIANGSIGVFDWLIDVTICTLNRRYAAFAYSLAKFPACASAALQYPVTCANPAWNGHFDRPYETSGPATLPVRTFREHALKPCRNCAE